jgi:hypothetical protein
MGTRLRQNLNKARLSTACAILLACWLAAVPAAGQAVSIIARFAPEAGNITDAVLLDNGHLALFYPDSGRIAEYSLDGTLHHHIVHEGGTQRVFTPVCGLAPSGANMLVFDAASLNLYRVELDGNIGKAVKLAYPAASGAIALSQLSGLSLDAQGRLWAMLTAEGKLAGFDRNGIFTEELDLTTLLPYTPACYTRSAWLPDGTLFLLDYSQGAILYRNPGEQAFRRVRLDAPEGVDAAPVLQDFAVDDRGHILAVTTASSQPVMLLTPSSAGYTAHRLNVPLPTGSNRLACRWSNGRFIVWLRDQPLVCILELSAASS